jgi:hypothetical protein
LWILERRRLRPGGTEPSKAMTLHNRTCGVLREAFLTSLS